MKYNSWKFLYPPRAEHAVMQESLAYYESCGWIFQYKKNGTNTTITIAPDGTIFFRTRHGELHKAWTCPSELKDLILAMVPRHCWTMLVAELMHSKTVSIKNCLYIYDVIVYQNEHLLGYSFTERQKLLDFYFPFTGIEEHSHWVLAEGIWRAKNFEKDFKKAFQNIKDPKIDEGLVLKDPNGKLQWCNRSNLNSSWQVKVRYPTKNYAY